MTDYIDQAKAVFAWYRPGGLPRGIVLKVTLRSEPALDDLITLAKQLKGDNQFGYAERLFELARKHRDYEPNQEKRYGKELLKDYLPQQQAICTYKNMELPASARFDAALQVLGDPAQLRDSTNQETLGIAGAIYKRRWEVNTRTEDLERSLAHYYRGYEQGRELPNLGDDGYTGINAAFVLELLAREDLASGVATESDRHAAADRLGRARVIRATIRDRLTAFWEAKGRPVDNWWLLVTLVEACIGLGDLDGAKNWLEQTRSLVTSVKPWELESMVSQQASLLRLQEALARLQAEAPQGEQASKRPTQSDRITRARSLLKEFLGDKAPGVDRAFSGKVGLALSGGGFRASLFHIGVLAYLADRDVLRHVEVLSCVSGGSIVGAYYYLKVKQLLESRLDAENGPQDRRIGPEQYTGIVADLLTNFVAGIQENIRTRLFGEATTNFVAAFVSEDARTRRLGSLYEEVLYSRAAAPPHPEGWHMEDLKMTPLGFEGTSFAPKYDNWYRRNRVPILVLNATTVNTGHNWQFTATWMGEPPAGIDAEVDGNYRLRRLYYSEAPPGEYRHFRLGHAVAASSCVPGLFEPLMLGDLYGMDDDKTVLLVDGGVHDNQGISSLLEQDCSVILVSDASGQMDASDHPDGGRLNMLFRTNNMLMARVREAEFREVEARRQTGLLRGLMYVHLKKDLPVRLVDWIGCDDPQGTAPAAGRETAYTIPEAVQRRLAAVRTDLDAFSQVEAYSLMASGYRMASRYFDACLPMFASNPSLDTKWSFLNVEAAWRGGLNTPAARDLDLQLEVAKSKWLKAWRLVPTLRGLGTIATILALVALIVVWRIWSERVVAGVQLTIGTLGWILVAVSVLVLIGRRLVHYVRDRWHVALGRLGLVNAFLLIGWVFFKLHRWFRIDRRFLKRGGIARLFGPGHVAGPARSPQEA